MDINPYSVEWHLFLAIASLAPLDIDELWQSIGTGKFTRKQYEVVLSALRAKGLVEIKGFSVELTREGKGAYRDMVSEATRELAEDQQAQEQEGC